MDVGPLCPTPPKSTRRVEGDWKLVLVWANIQLKGIMKDSRRVTDPEILPPEKMVSYKVSVRSHPAGESYTVKPIGKLQLFLWSIVGLLAGSVVLAFFLAAFAIGLILALPLVLLGFFQLVRLWWRLRKYQSRPFPR